MSDSDYYPAGAYNDPSAPYNEPPSLDDMFGDDADAILQEDIDKLDDDFIDWMNDNSLCPYKQCVENGEIKEETFNQILRLLASDEFITDEYIKSNHDNMVQHLYDEYCTRYDEPEY